MPADDMVAAAEMVGTSAQCRPAALWSGYPIPLLSRKGKQMGLSPALARSYEASAVSGLRVQQASFVRQRMIRKSGGRFSEKIMLKPER